MTDLRPWNGHHDAGSCIGEVWFQRRDASAPDSALLLKLLYTSRPLSIQVHPDDAYARSIRLPHGKSEAWYILDAAREARIALGLKRALSTARLRASIDDGSIEELVQWRRVARDDVISVPAGTIHAMGAGIVAMEVQQRSDTTYRLFDFGRQREIHAASAVAAAYAGPAAAQPRSRSLSMRRTLLLASPHFVLERVELPPLSVWHLSAPDEMWLFVVEGRARVAEVSNDVGDVMFLASDRTQIRVGRRGVKALAAYAGPDPMPDLLRPVDRVQASLAPDHAALEGAQ